MSFPSTSPPSVHPYPIHPAISRELYLLRLRAETFRVELELERQLQLRGAATLPLEWSAYIEHERQLLLDKIQWIEFREEYSTSSLGMAHSTHTLPSNGGHNESTRGFTPIISHIRPEESTHPFVPSENEGNVRSPSHSISSTVHGHTDVDERILQSPAIATGSLSLDHERTQRDSPRRTARTRRDAIPRVVERDAYQSHSGMFNSAQSVTISGGVFTFAQGNISCLADEMLALE